MAMKVTADAARRFLFARQFLAPARSLEGGPKAVLEVFGRLGSIQFDPIAVAGRNHDLVLHARVAEYDPAWCDALYERREIFEATNKALSFVPTSEFPWFRADEDHPGRLSANRSACHASLRGNASRTATTKRRSRQPGRGTFPNAFGRSGIWLAIRTKGPLTDSWAGLPSRRDPWVKPRASLVRRARPTSPVSKRE
jgi:uncharacterized protein YcaQ